MHPFEKEIKSEQECLETIERYMKKCDEVLTSGHNLSLNAFISYLNDQYITNTDHENVYQDMDKTFASYFIRYCKYIFVFGELNYII